MILLLAAFLTLPERESFERAIALHLASHLEEAERGYAGVLERHPDFLPARLYRAEALWLLGRSDEAKKDVEGASELLLVRILQRAFGSSSEGHPLVEKLLAAYPLGPNRFLATGTPALLLLSMGEVDEAIDDYRRAAEIDPGDLTLHRQVANAFSKAKLSLPAVEAFERVVVLAPEDVSAWRQLGSGNLVLQRWVPAIQAFERALGLSGENPSLLLALGYAYERTPDSEKALELYRRAAKLAPEAGRPHYRIGRALMAQGNLEEAQKELEAASALDPAMPEPLGFLGEILLKRGSIEVAVETLERAVALDPEYFEAYYHLAQAYRREGREDEAKKAIRLYDELKRKKRGVLSQDEVLAVR